MKGRAQGVDAKTLHRIASLHRELSDIYETLAAEQKEVGENRPPTSPDAPRRARTRRIYVPGDEPSELDVARAKAILKRLGYT